MQQAVEGTGLTVATRLATVTSQRTRRPLYSWVALAMSSWTFLAG